MTARSSSTANGVSGSNPEASRPIPYSPLKEEPLCICFVYARIPPLSHYHGGTVRDHGQGKKD
jgi:hypothetical protein